MVTKSVDDLRGVRLELDPRKCELTILSHSKDDEIQMFESFKELLPELKLVPAAKCFLLGATLSKEGISVAIREKCDDFERLVSKLKIIKNHQAFILLKKCFVLPKLQYILRASLACSHIKDLEKFDDTLVAAVAVVTNIKFWENSLALVALLIRLRGLAIKMAKDIALQGFISFLHVVRELVVVGILNNILLRESNDLSTADRE